MDILTHPIWNQVTPYKTKIALPGTYSQTEVLIPTFNFNGGTEFSGPYSTFEIDTFSFTNETIISYSYFGQCNSYHTLTRPGAEFFFGTRIPTLENVNVNPGPSGLSSLTCDGSGLFTDFLTNYRGNFDTNLLYQKLEGVFIQGYPVDLPVPYPSSHASHDHKHESVQDRLAHYLQNHSLKGFEDPDQFYVAVLFIFNCDKLVLC